MMQYTGLKDKNGREIYEGDVVKYQLTEGFDAKNDYRESIRKIEMVSEVKYLDGQFWPREYFNYCEDGHYSDRRFDFEIIGNIWENPEMLK